MPTTERSSAGWIQTMIGAATAIVVTGTGLYGIVIVPMEAQIARLVDGREKDHDQLAALYTSIQTNDEYKKTIAGQMLWLRADIDKVQAQANALDQVHKDRAGQAAQITDLQARWDRLDRHNEELDERNNPTILEDVKALRLELDSLRQHIMVPITGKP
jgi:peptidoglycan hydrolase CwlO-like protein